MDHCHVHGGPNTFIRILSRAGNITVSGTNFTGCSFAQPGFIAIVGSDFPVGLFSVFDCNFTDCHSSAQSTLFKITNGTCDTSSIERCRFESCTGGGTNGLFNIISSSLIFRSNEVIWSATDVKPVCLFGLHDEKQELIIEEDIFSGLGTIMGESHFVGVPSNMKRVSFVGCTFEDANSNGAAAFEMEVDTLNVIGCEFRDLSCVWNGGAFHTGGSTRLIMENCSISSCSCGAGTNNKTGNGGGGI